MTGFSFVLVPYPFFQIFEILNISKLFDKSKNSEQKPLKLWLLAIHRAYQIHLFSGSFLDSSKHRNLIFFLKPKILINKVGGTEFLF